MEDFSRTLTDPSFIGPKFEHCDVELGVLDESIVGEVIHLNISFRDIFRLPTFDSQSCSKQDPEDEVIFQGDVQYIQHRRCT